MSDKINSIFSTLEGDIQSSLEGYKKGEITELDSIDSNIRNLVKLINELPEEEMAKYLERFQALSKNMSELNEQIKTEVTKIQENLKDGAKFKGADKSYVKASNL